MNYIGLLLALLAVLKPVGAANSKRFGLDVILKRSRRCLPDSCKGTEDLLRIRPCSSRGDFVLIYTFCAWKSSTSGILIFALNRDLGCTGSPRAAGGEESKKGKPP